MRIKLEPVVYFRGSAEYVRFLDSLRALLGSRGVILGSNHELAEYAIARLARASKVPPVPRSPSPGRGGNRAGSGRKPKPSEGPQ